MKVQSKRHPSGRNRTGVKMKNSIFVAEGKLLWVARLN